MFLYILFLLMQINIHQAPNAGGVSIHCVTTALLHIFHYLLVLSFTTLNY